jgi:hypothetical protein
MSRGGVQATVGDWRVSYSHKGITVWNRSVPGLWTRVAWVLNRWHLLALAEGWGDDGADLLRALEDAVDRARVRREEARRG